MQLRKYKIKNLFQSFFTTQRSKNIFVYLIFVVISFVFWLLLTLNNQVQQEYKIPINLIDIPDSVTVLAKIPSDIKVVVKEKGTTLLRYSMSSSPVLNIKFKDYTDGEKRFKITSGQMRNLIGNLLGNNVSLVSVFPDSLSIPFTMLPPKRVPIIFNVKAVPNFQYIVSDNYKASTSYAYVYANRETLSRIKSVDTYTLEENDLKDTIKRVLNIKPIPNVKIVPGTVTIVIPVQPLITKRITVPVISKGVPYGVNIVTFPSKVSITYLVPANEYKESQNLNAEVYYQDVIEKSNKLKLYVNNPSWRYGDVSFEMDSVEYIIEKVQD